MGGSSLLIYYNPHSVIHFSSSFVTTRSNFRQPTFHFKETAVKPSVLSVVRADGNRRDRPQKDSSDPPQQSSTTNSNKEEILALFRRIQSSISKGGVSVNSKKRNTKHAASSEDNKASTESILEVLRQSKTRGKERNLAKKGDKLLVSQKESSNKEERIIENLSLTKEERVENSSERGLKSTRPPSKFTRRSPIPPPLSSPTENVERKSETSANDNEQQSEKFEEMKLAELKEVAKSKGIKGYSKLKKSELVELLIRSSTK